LSNNDPAAITVQPGYYRHYKGQYYQVLSVALHSEENQPYVVYRALYGEFGLWVRPLAMFCEKVDTAAGPMPRFAFVGAAANW
jgi:hypothetical protein